MAMGTIDIKIGSASDQTGSDSISATLGAPSIKPLSIRFCREFTPPLIKFKLLDFGPIGVIVPLFA